MADKSLVQHLLDIGAVQLSTEDLFTWTSGLRSPIYCDNRLTMSYPAIRNEISAQFATYITNMEAEIDMIAGCATAGIPHAAWVADRLHLPMVYVRSSAKKHGKGNQIEGAYEKGKKAVVIEDLISTGKSSIEAAEALEKEGIEVVAVLSIFHYNLTAADEAFQSRKLPAHSLTGYNQLIDTMESEGLLSKEHHDKLMQWRENPSIFTQS
ncbi:orotate phosphoribosyltransferase [Halobacillus amylolyticus]|uniref:Orotate phosphoribosyltransferase n=1 Tax=Halobacillus amylolyticus TaxID=2932259 RepID=A0ABY4HDF7_9BACI|nr:orotate phosphoribosyltransferase [Halobacillus amylolyticus]UOR12892.1 orotate phosphoribosyltransferase [Halobacillus amylolyticus]